MVDGEPQPSRRGTAQPSYVPARVTRPTNRSIPTGRQRSVPTISCGAGFSSACDASYARVCADLCQSSSYPLNISKQEGSSEVITGPPMRRTRSLAIRHRRPQGRHPIARAEKYAERPGPVAHVAPQIGSGQPILRIVPQRMLNQREQGIGIVGLADEELATCGAGRPNDVRLVRPT